MRYNLFVNLAGIILLLLSSLPSRAFEFNDTSLDTLETTDSFLSLFSSKSLLSLVKNIGDINADGIDDLMISNVNPIFNNLERLIYIVFGSQSNPSLIDLDNLYANRQGFTIKEDKYIRIYDLGPAGDINNDGINDFMFGFSCDVYVIFGRIDEFTDIDVTNLTNTQGFRIYPNYIGISSPWLAVSKAGDFNNDGIDDIIVGNMRESPLNRFSAGSVYILFGHAGAFSDVNLAEFTSGTQGLKIIGAQTYDSLGLSVNSAGDFNGDGVDDVVTSIGSPLQRADANKNKLYVIYGHEGEFQDLDLAILTKHQGFQITDRDNDESKGTYRDMYVTNAGDFDGDGLNDITFRVTGTVSMNDAILYVIFGVDGGYNDFDINDLQETQGLKVDSNEAFENAFYLPNSADVNGDGMSDLLIGLSHKFQVVFGRKERVRTINLDNLTSADGFKINGTSHQLFSGDCLDFNNDGAIDIVIGTSNVSVFYGKPMNRNPKDEPNVAAIVAGVVVPCVVLAIGIGIYIKRKRSINEKANDEIEKKKKKMKHTSESPNQDLPISTVLQWPSSPVTSTRETAPMLFKTMVTQEPQESLAVQEVFIELQQEKLHPPKPSIPGDKKEERSNESCIDLASVLGQKMNKQADGEGEGQIQQDLDVSSLLEQAVKDEEVPPGESDKCKRVD